MPRWAAAPVNPPGSRSASATGIGRRSHTTSTSVCGRYLYRAKRPVYSSVLASLSSFRTSRLQKAFGGISRCSILHHSQLSIHFSSYSSTAVTPYSFNIRLMSGHVMYPSATQEAAWLSSEASCCKSSIGASCLSMRTYSIKSMPLLSPSTMPSLYALSTSACVRGTLRGLIRFGIVVTVHPFCVEHRTIYQSKILFHYHQ